jgi:hypothetical protein
MRLRARLLDALDDWMTVCVAGLLGTCIGLLAIPLRTLRAGGVPVRLLSGMEYVFEGAFTTYRGVLLLALPMFCSTVALTPFFLEWLRDQRRRHRARFWPSAMGGGVAFGFFACVATGFFMGLFMPFVIEDGDLLTRFRLLAGAPAFMAVVGAIAFPMVFWLEIALGGVVFGLCVGLLSLNAAVPGRSPHRADDRGR